MSVSLVINGTTYPFPEQGDEDWGLQATDAIVAITNGMLQKAGGNFTLLADTNFGATYGLISTYYKSRSSNIADAGVLRLAVGDVVNWRNNANSGNIGLAVNGSDELTFNGNKIIAGLSVSDSSNIDLTLAADVLSALIIPGSIVNADISNSAAIAQSKLTLSITNAEVDAAAAIVYSKLLLTNSIVNADISSSAAIVYSKLNLSNSIVNADISASAAIAQSKLNLSITDSEVNASAAIARTKIANGTADHVVINNGSGTLSSEAALAKVRGGTGADNSSVTFPSTGIIVTEAGTQTLTNKTLTTPTLTNPYVNDTIAFEERFSTPSTPSAGRGTLFLQGGLAKFQWIDDSGTVRDLGGGGGGSINFLPNPDAEADTSEWDVYANSVASSQPQVGTVMTNTDVILTRDTSFPLYGTASFRLTKNAGNQQGSGVRNQNIEIPFGYQGSVVTIKHIYRVVSGTFNAGSSTADSDVTMWISDNSTNVLYQPSSYRLLSNSTSVPDQFEAEFQVPVGGSGGFTLYFHIATTNSSAWAIEFDQVIVTPSVYTLGSPDSDWIAYTPTFTGFGTVVTQNVRYRRSGPDIEVMGAFTFATTTSVEARVSLPTGLRSISTLPTLSIVGDAAKNSGAGGTYFGNTALIEASVTYITFGTQTNGTNGLSKALGSQLGTSGEIFSFNAKVPIAGQSASVQMAEQTSTRVVSAIITGDPASASSGNPIIVPTVSYDSHAAYDSATGRYTCPAPGIYKVYGALQSASSATTLTIYKNAVSTILAGNLDSNGDATFIGSVNCITGDILDIRPGGTVDATSMALNFERLSGPSQIASSETIAAKAAGDPASASSGNPIIFPTEAFDTHGSYDPTTGRFTCPITGIYQVFGAIDSANTGVRLTIYKNASIDTIAGATDSNGEGVFNGLVNCIAGDILDVRPNNTLDATSGSNINFLRIGLRG